MKFNKALGLASLCLSILSCAKQNLPDYAEIPFKLENDRVVVEATVNGKKGSFVFDTGSTESYVDTNTINLFPRAYTKTPYNGKRKIVLVYNLNEITFGDVVLGTRSWVIKRSDIITRTKNEGYDGVLGSRIFEGYWCELSFSKSKIILHKEKPDYFTRFSPIKILSKYDADFFVPAIIDGETFYFDIDTGMPPGIFFPDGLVRIKNSDEYQEIMSDEEAGTYHLVKTNTIQILDETYTGQFVMTNSIIAARSRYVDDGLYGDLKDLGMVGIDFLRYYDFLFDYRDLRNGKATGLYYEPNTPLEERNYGFFSLLKEAPELGILNFDKSESGLLIRSVIKDSIAHKTFGFRPGTIITKINGRPIAELSQEELLDPSFYLAVANYTTLENDVERTVPSPFKGALDETPASVRRD